MRQGGVHAAAATAAAAGASALFVAGTGVQPTIFGDDMLATAVVGEVLALPVLHVGTLQSDAAELGVRRAAAAEAELKAPSVWFSSVAGAVLLSAYADKAPEGLGGATLCLSASAASGGHAVSRCWALDVRGNVLNAAALSADGCRVAVAQRLCVRVFSAEGPCLALLKMPAISFRECGTGAETALWAHGGDLLVCGAFDGTLRGCERHATHLAPRHVAPQLSSGAPPARPDAAVAMPGTAPTRGRPVARAARILRRSARSVCSPPQSMSRSMRRSRRHCRVCAGSRAKPHLSLSPRGRARPSQRRRWARRSCCSAALRAARTTWPSRQCRSCSGGARCWAHHCTCRSTEQYQISDVSAGSASLGRCDSEGLRAHARACILPRSQVRSPKATTRRSAARQLRRMDAFSRRARMAHSAAGCAIVAIETHASPGE